MSYLLYIYNEKKAKQMILSAYHTTLSALFVDNYKIFIFTTFTILVRNVLSFFQCLFNLLALKFHYRNIFLNHNEMIVLRVGKIVRSYLTVCLDLVVDNNYNNSVSVLYFSDYLKLVELQSLFYFFIFLLIFLGFIYTVFFLVTGRFFKNIFEFKETTYECGFYAYNIELHNTVLLSYFKPLMLFLIFDLEVIYFVPLLFVSKGLLLVGVYFVYIATSLFFLILLLGLLCEFILNQ
jgi:NADH:ubiquinone oxidoreductase subunit 3 (subunit A)